MKKIWKTAEKDVIIHGNMMNIVESCVDRHAADKPDKVALVFEDNGKRIEYTYKRLEGAINRFANLLKKLNVPRNSRVFIFLPKVPEMYIAFLGTIKYGCIAAPLFEAFQEEGLMLRLEKGEANVLVTNTELSWRVPKDVKKRIKSLKHVLITDSDYYIEQIASCSNVFQGIWMKRENSSLMIFTSSTAGTPVAGVMLPHYGLVQQHMTAKLVLGLKEEDKYWCTAHPGWVTGSVYGIIAPLSIGCTNYIYEGHFDSHKWIDFIKRNNISVIYTAPTALKMLKPDIKKEDLTGVRNLCSVGEALPESIFDFYKGLGVEINDTYWQSETGAMIIANYPGVKKKPGSLGKPLPGIKADLKSGMITIRPGWPAMMTEIYKHEQMYKNYFKNGWFLTNDLARKDDEGYFFFEGRHDDIIKTSGERVSPLEIENVLHMYRNVKEAAVIGINDKVRGQIIKAFIVLGNYVKPSEKLKEDIRLFVKNNYAGHAYPKEIEFVDKLPKTNSGKIVRMKLKEIEEKKNGKSA